jgi:hypothetical protein
MFGGAVRLPGRHADPALEQTAEWSQKKRPGY